VRRRIEANEAAFGPNGASVLEFLASLLSQLIEDDRAEAFIEFAAGAPAQLDGLLDALLEAYAHSVEPEGTEQALSRTKEYCESLRQSARLLRSAFSTSLFEAADTSLGVMRRDERLQFLERLEQAAVTIELFDVVIDKQIFATPKTRKHHGKEGARTLFSVTMTEVFERQFGRPYHPLVADIADVLFDGTKDTFNADAVRTAARRWKKRKDNGSEPELRLSLSEELKPYEAAIRLVFKTSDKK
jgi:hypothetical protein